MYVTWVVILLGWGFPPRFGLLSCAIGLAWLMVHCWGRLIWRVQAKFVNCAKERHDRKKQIENKLKGYTANEFSQLGALILDNPVCYFAAPASLRSPATARNSHIITWLPLIQHASKI